MSARGFPNAPEFTGLNTPIGEEYELDRAARRGPHSRPKSTAPSSAPFPIPPFRPTWRTAPPSSSGDGMVSALRFAGGQGELRDSLRPDRAAPGRGGGRAAHCSASIAIPSPTSRRSPASTARSPTRRPVWHAGRLLMTKEDGRPYRVDPQTLATLGRYDFGGRLRSADRDGARAHRSAHRRDVLLRLRGRRTGLDQGRLLHRRPARRR